MKRNFNRLLNQLLDRGIISRYKEVKNNNLADINKSTSANSENSPFRLFPDFQWLPDILTLSIIAWTLKVFKMLN